MGETIIASDCSGRGIPIYSADTSAGPWNYSDHPKLRLRRGTIVVGARGSIGFPRMPTDDVFAATQTTLVVVPDSEQVWSRYVFHALRGVDFSTVTAQQAVPMLTARDLGGVLINTPPLPEQQLIASILDTVDEVIRKTEEVIAKLQQMKQGLLHDLLTRGIDDNGELRDPDRHPEQFKDSPLGRIPKDWDVVRAGALCSVITKGTTPSKQEMWEGSDGVRFLRVDNLTFDGGLELAASDFRVSWRTHTGFLSRSRVYAGDVLTNIVGPPLGKIAMITPEVGEVNVNQAIALFRPAQRIASNFLLLWLESSISQRWFRTRAKQTSGQINLTLQMCQELPVPLPDIAEQTRVVAAYAALRSRVRREHAELAKLRLLKSGLMDDLLTGRVRVTDLLPTTP